MKEVTIPTLKELLEAGVYFGHKKQYSDSRGRDNFYTVKDKIVIIDLEKTRAALESAIKFISSQALHGATFLFVGTKVQAKNIIKETAESVEMPYVINRWLGGTLTNFSTIEKNLKDLEEMETASQSEEATKSRTKKESAVLARSISRAKYNLGGIKKLNKLPDVLIAVDAAQEKLAIAEARTVGIPVVAIADTNANPLDIDYAIPANDDVPSSLKLLISVIENAIKLNYKKPVEDTKKIVAGK